MKERPILFSAPMVRALLDGSKTQTRRAVRKQFGPDAEPAEVAATSPEGWQSAGHSGLWWDDAGACIDDAIRCPYGKPGDRLWVRETFVQGYPYDATTDSLLQSDADGNDLPMKTWYRADGADIGWSDGDGWQANVPWKPSIHMPRTASRITLEIVSVRVERLQDISEADAIAEGCAKNHNGYYWGGSARCQWIETTDHRHRGLSRPLGIHQRPRLMGCKPVGVDDRI